LPFGAALPLPVPEAGDLKYQRAYSVVISIWLLFSMLGMSHHEGEQLTATKIWYTWIQAGNFHIDWGYFFDPLTAIMLCVVCGIGFFITVFAIHF